MPTLQVFPPNTANEALFGEIPGIRQTPIPVIAFDGPDGHLGPEATGAILVLHMTMVDGERTQAFWRQVAITCRAASEWPGFIRLVAFFDGIANWAIGFWRTVEDAESYKSGAVHRAAMAGMYETKFEYTHFAGLFSPVSARPREVYCERCGAEAHMPIDACPACGNEIADVFSIQAGLVPAKEA